MGCAGMCFGAVVLGGVTRLVTIQSETNTEFCSIIVYTVSTCTTIHHIFDNDVMCFTSQTIFWSLCYLSLHLQLLIAPLISFDHCVICPSIYSF
jgi:hypothetical protein